MKDFRGLKTSYNPHLGGKMPVYLGSRRYAPCQTFGATFGMDVLVGATSFG